MQNLHWIQPIKVKSATGEDFIALIHQVEIPKANTNFNPYERGSFRQYMEAPIDDDFSISDALSGHNFNAKDEYFPIKYYPHMTI